MDHVAHAAPFYVVVGHVAQDLVPASDCGAHDDLPPRYVPGGTALYAALTARRLGVETGVVTSAASTFDPSVLEGSRVHVVPSPDATIFENRYEPGGRVQFLHARARTIAPGDVPPAWHSARVLHLGPIADEVDPAITTLFPQALRAATPQGWTRRWADDKRVYARPHEAIMACLRGLDVVVLSEEDVSAGLSPRYDTPEKVVGLYREHVRIVVLTRSARGATIYAGKGTMHVPAYHADEKDPTGAGDVFASAFLIRYAHEKDLLGAARFAAATASLAVEGIGASAIPTLGKVEERVARGAWRVAGDE